MLKQICFVTASMLLAHVQKYKGLRGAQAIGKQQQQQQQQRQLQQQQQNRLRNMFDFFQYFTIKLHFTICYDNQNRAVLENG